MSSGMTPERFRKIDEILETALARPLGERAAFLDEACGDDAELRREVEELLAHDETEDFLDRPAIRDRDLGRRFGHYQTERLLGRGGMGAVYLAAREDDYTQKVALKLIQRGMDSEEIVRRFLAERQILADLEHPNVARILDGGTAEDGRPFFVMEYVEGEPLDRYCDRHGLGLEHRLELFREVSGAVQKAHQSLVVHCDLKPGNILVDAAGTPKLLDFGIAKLLQPGGLPDGQLTVTGLRPMTPQYASPEQIRGERLTTASDVYSLGVLLYRLLTGHRPYRLDGLTVDQVLRTVIEDEPQRPSTAAGLSPERRRELSGDLDAIILKAMRKEPEHRYGSVGELVEDLRRHLTGRPVSARGDALAYRTGKFIRRHRWGVGVAVLFAALILGFIVVVTAQLERTERVASSLEGILRATLPSRQPGEESTLQAALDDYATILDEQLSGQPLKLARMLDVVGRAHLHYGFHDKAREALEKALVLREENLPPDDPLIAESLHNLAYFFQQIDDDELAVSHYRRSIEIERRRRQTPEVEKQLAIGLSSLGTLLQTEGRLDEAEQVYEEALALREKLYARDADDLLLLDLVRTRINRGTLWMRQGRLDEAENVFRQSLAIRRRILGEEHPDVARTLNQLASVLFQRGELEQAEEKFSEALDVWRKILIPEHVRFAGVLNNYGKTLVALDRPEEAEPKFREALGIFLARYGDDHPNVAIARVNIAETIVSTNSREAERLARRGLAVFRERYGDDNLSRVAVAESILGSSLASQRRFEEAEPLLVGAYCRLAEGLGVDHVDTRRAFERFSTYEALHSGSARSAGEICADPTNRGNRG